MLVEQTSWRHLKWRLQSTSLQCLEIFPYPFLCETASTGTYFRLRRFAFESRKHDSVCQKTWKHDCKMPHLCCNAVHDCSTGLFILDHTVGLVVMSAGCDRQWMRSRHALRRLSSDPLDD